MRRFISALLILILAVSHAPMSAAIPHVEDAFAHAIGGHDDHAHADELASADAGHDALGADTVLGNKTSPAKAPATAAHHHHVSVDAVMIASSDFARVPVADARQLPADDAALSPAHLNSISEPPIA